MKIINKVNPIFFRKSFNNEYSFMKRDIKQVI